MDMMTALPSLMMDTRVADVLASKNGLPCFDHEKVCSRPLRQIYSIRSHFTTESHSNNK